MGTYNSFKKVDKDLNILFVVSLILFTMTELLGDTVADSFWVGVKLMDVGNKVSLAYITGYIFYYLVVHLKDIQNKRNIKDYVSSKCNIVISDFHQMLKDISDKTEVKLSGRYSSKAEIKTMFGLVNPNLDAPMLLGSIDQFANWMQYFNFFRGRSIKAIKSIYDKLIFLDTELITIVSKIEDCVFLTLVEQTVHQMPVKNQDMAYLAESFHVFSELVRELEDYVKNIQQD